MAHRQYVFKLVHHLDMYMHKRGNFQAAHGLLLCCGTCCGVTDIITDNIVNTFTDAIADSIQWRQKQYGCYGSGLTTFSDGSPIDRAICSYTSLVPSRSFEVCIAGAIVRGYSCKVNTVTTVTNNK